MTSVYYPQWRDENAEIRYPFEDESTMLDSFGQVMLLDDWLVDAAIYSPVAQPPVYLRQVKISGNVAYLSLSDAIGQDIGTGIASRQSAAPIAVRDANGLPVATLVPSSTNHANLFAPGDGTFQFTAQATSFVSSCVLENPAAALQGFRVGSEIYLQNEMIFVGETGVQLTMDDTEEVDVNGVTHDVALLRVHAVGDPQRLARECSDPSRRPSRFIREVVFQYGDFTHSCVPDQYGNMVFVSGSPAVSDSSLRIQNFENKIRLDLMGQSIS